MWTINRPFLLLFGFSLLLASVAAAQDFMDPYNDLNRVDENDPVNQFVPNPSNPKELRSLMCGACGAITEHAVELLKPVIERYRAEWAAKRTAAKPQEYETIDAHEKLCAEVGNLYGILVDETNFPTMSFSRSELQQRLRGGWMPTFLSRACEELLEEHEEALIAHIFDAAKKGGSNAHIAEVTRRRLCSKWDAANGGCDRNGQPIDERERPSNAGDL